MTGIDISADQGDNVPGAWDFIVIKLSEAQSAPNFRFDAQWANAKRTTRGVYHYARPGISSGFVQGNYFADLALSKGFKPNIDIWQLDAEDGENAGVGNWAQFIIDFFNVVTAKLGGRGFLYAGWPFVVEHGLQSLLFTKMWWLPGYGPNDGTDHGITPGAPDGLVVIHQFTSKPLDQNHIVNAAAYHQTVGPLPPIVTPGRNFVQPDLYPPVGIVSLCAFNHNGVPSAAAVKPDGSVFCSPATSYSGGCNGKPYFADRVAAKIVAVTGGYQIIDTAGEKYGPVF